VSQAWLWYQVAPPAEKAAWAAGTALVAVAFVFGWLIGV
jgi:hypothetical protein